MSVATTKQMQHWSGNFGRDYTKRNNMSLEDMDRLWHSRYGVTRSEAVKEFLGSLDRSARILEVGCNIGNQLLCLQGLGFSELYAIELQSEAVETAKARTSGISIIRGSAFDIPFKDGYFDLVFTAGVLIHIHPSDVREAMKEIHRCTRQYIWGSEYWSEEFVAIPYRGHSDLLWKADYARIYMECFHNLSLIREQHLNYRDGTGNVDTLFLLEKRSG